MNLSNKNVIHQKKESIEFLQFKKLLQYPELVHCYTLKANNFDISGANAINNYEKLGEALEIPKETIIKPYQSHTNIVKNVGEDFISAKQNKISIFPEEFKDVDGLITDQPDITFSLGFADCTPIYLYDPVKKVIGDIHSGWKGTLQRIGQIAIKKMIEEYNCNPKDIICCIGPCIKKCHFEVSKDVKDLFKNEFKEMDLNEIIENIGDSKYLIDTTKINENMMRQIGLKEENIIDSGICTVCNKDQMHSYRAHKELAGRNTAILGLRRK